MIQSNQRLMETINKNYEEIQVQNGSELIIVNKNTGQQFYAYETMNMTNQQLKKMKQRSQFFISFTPKIYVRQNTGIILVQKAQYSLDKMVSKYREIGSDLVPVFFDILRTAQLLSKRYGCFKFTEKMIAVSKGPSMMVWINENFALNQPQFTIPNQIQSRQNQMMESLLNVLKRKMPGVSLIKRILTQMKSNQNFQIKAQIDALKSIPKKMPSFLFERRRTTKKRCESIIVQDSEKKARDSVSTEVSEGSLISKLKKMGKLQTLNAKIALIEREILQSVIVQSQADQIWSKDIEKQFTPILYDQTN